MLDFKSLSVSLRNERGLAADFGWQSRFAHCGNLALLKQNAKSQF